MLFGGVGIGSGVPLALRTVAAGGLGIGRGVPLTLRTAEAGGLGIGKGVPLALRTVAAGGLGIGSGVPLALRTVEAGGLGIGSGVPLIEMEAIAIDRLLDKCLPEVLMGSTIKTAHARTARLTKIVFFMDEPLLAQP